MATARVAVVVSVIARKPHKQRPAVIFDRAAYGADLLVVIFLTRCEIGAESLARQDCAAAANREAAVTDGQGEAGGQIGLIIGAVGRPQVQPGRVAQTAADIFDRAANGVAPVKRTLRPAQYLDPLQIVYFKHCSLRSVEIDIVEIDADARFETSNGILLADTANEGRQRGIGTA